MLTHSPIPVAGRLEEVAEVLKALAQPIRLAIVYRLEQAECSAGDLADAVGAERTNVSRHLAVLLHAGVVACRRDKQQMLYRLRTPCVLRIFDCIDGVLSDSSETGSRCCASLPREASQRA
jgi:ArsR family transcriptional regulator